EGEVADRTIHFTAFWLSYELSIDRELGPEKSAFACRTARGGVNPSAHDRGTSIGTLVDAQLGGMGVLVRFKQTVRDRIWSGQSFVQSQDIDVRMSLASS